MTAGNARELAELVEARGYLVSSPDFGAYFRMLLSESGVTICSDPTSVDCRGYFEPEANIIALAPQLTCAEKTLILAHELRHLDQYRRGFSLSVDHAMSEHVRLTYALEADSQAFVAFFAWSERDRQPLLWETALRLSRYEDIAVAVREAAEAGASPKETMLAGFTAWYASSWRVQQYYRSAAANYLDQLDETRAIPRYAMYPDDRFDALCRMPDGSSYGCERTAEIATRPVQPP